MEQKKIIKNVGVKRNELARQVQLAKKELKRWPKWMRVTARIEGISHADYEKS